MEKKGEERVECNYEEASWWSTITLGWLNRLVSFGRTHYLE